MTGARTRPRPRGARPVPGRRSRSVEPDIARQLLRLQDEDEVVVDVVRQHWATYLRPGVQAAGGVAALLCVPFVDLDHAWLVLVVAAVLVVPALVTISDRRKDRLIITNMRVFRIDGVFTIKVATMPLNRILDITVVRPPIGRILGFGHFTFESAAQDQGLREVRYVARPQRRDHTIQGLVQQAGLRGKTSA